MTYIQYANAGTKIQDKAVQLYWPLIGGQLLSSDTTKLGDQDRQSIYINEKYQQDDGTKVSVSKAIYPDGYRSISILNNDLEFNQGYRPDGSINYTVEPDRNNAQKKSMNYFEYTNKIPKGQKGLFAKYIWDPLFNRDKEEAVAPQDSWNKETGSIIIGGKTYSTNNNNDVVALQNELISKGYDVGRTGADGKFGRNTENALNQYLTGVSPATAKSQPSNNQSNTSIINLDGQTYNTRNPNDVTALQTYLIGKGYNVGKTGADGKFGRNTINALNAYNNDRPVNLNTTSLNTEEVRSLLGELVNNSANPHLQAAYKTIDPTSQFGQNDQEVIKQLQARFNLPVTGVFDDKTLERFNHENSLRGKIENVYETFARPGSVGRQFARAAAQAVLPDGWVKTKNLFRGDFSDTQQQQFDYILKSAAGAAPGVYSLSGAQYSDGYAPGHANYDANMVRRAVDILSGNDQQSGSFSIGGATVSTHMFPNGKKGSLLTDQYDFNNAAPEHIEQQEQAIQNDPNLTQEEKNRKLAELNTSIAAIEARVAKGQGDRSSTRTYYGLFEDGTPMTEEDVQWALNDRNNYPAKKRKDGSTYRPALANHADINDMMYTTWTGTGNTYKGSTESTYTPSKFAQVFADGRNWWDTHIAKSQGGSKLNYLKYIQ